MATKRKPLGPPQFVVAPGAHIRRADANPIGLEIEALARRQGLTAHTMAQTAPDAYVYDVLHGGSPVSAGYILNPLFTDAEARQKEYESRARWLLRSIQFIGFKYGPVVPSTPAFIPFRYAKTQPATYYSRTQNEQNPAWRADEVRRAHAEFCALKKRWAGSVTWPEFAPLLPAWRALP